ncbi:MAG: hypothetical protein EOO38_20420 [Cytophagaceae bacterium]|nr:MAG: hypothetical protein EOO38_20420 [Cytophagaceae bacterium]
MQVTPTTNFNDVADAINGNSALQTKGIHMVFFDESLTMTTRMPSAPPGALYVPAIYRDNDFGENEDLIAAGMDATLFRGFRTYEVPFVGLEYVDFPAATFLRNDTGKNLRIISVTNPSKIGIRFNAATQIISLLKPSLENAAPDQFTYTISDGTSSRSTANVRVRVSALKANDDYVVLRGGFEVDARAGTKLVFHQGLVSQYLTGNTVTIMGVQVPFNEQTRIDELARAFNLAAGNLGMDLSVGDADGGYLFDPTRPGYLILTIYAANIPVGTVPGELFGTVREIKVGVARGCDFTFAEIMANDIHSLPITITEISGMPLSQLNDGVRFGRFYPLPNNIGVRYVGFTYDQPFTARYTIRDSSGATSSATIYFVRPPE